MTYIELKAEVFRLIRAFDGGNPKKLHKAIKDHLGEDYDKELVVKAITELMVD